MHWEYSTVITWYIYKTYIKSNEIINKLLFIIIYRSVKKYICFTMTLY